VKNDKLDNCIPTGSNTRSPANVPCCSPRGTSRDNPMGQPGSISASSALHGHGLALEPQPGSGIVDRPGKFPAGTVLERDEGLGRHSPSFYAVSGNNLVFLLVAC
jgi:hypothetical protein